MSLPFMAIAPAAAAGSADAAPETTNEPIRTIVTTDPELDDLNSLLRMLLYSNEIDIDGLVYSSSQHHFEGDPEAGIEPFRWPAPDAVFHIDEAVNRYASSYENLKVHDAAYPTPEELRSTIAWGNVKTKGDMSEETDGSRLIEKAILDDEPGKLFLQAWGGPNTIARALLSIQEDYSGTSSWDAVQQKVYDKVVLTSYGQQDDTFRDYIRPNWPRLDQREVATAIWGYFARGSALPEWQQYLSPEWTEANVSSVGEMGDGYRVWGDGKQMAAGFDDEDYFGLSGYTADELTEMGYGVWTAPQPKGAWISEGDSSNFALLVQNGLRNSEDPSWGGWGGRQAVNPDDPYQWRNSGVQDIGPDGTPRNDYAAGRWFEDFQLDFAARLRWAVTPTYGDANHEPVVSLTSDLNMDLTPSQTVPVAATVSDPDGDSVTSRWWQYREAGTYDGEASVADEDALSTTFTVPADAPVGSTIHLIAEARDNGTPALASWQRVVVTVVDKHVPALDGTAPVASTTGHTEVTLVGTALFGATSLTVGGTPVADFVVAPDGRSVKFTAPEREAAGTTPVVVTTPGGTAEGALEYVAPTATTLSPARGPATGGTKVTLEGTDLAAASGVTVGGAKATDVTPNADGTSVTFTTPAGTQGGTPVVVILPGIDATAAESFNFAAVSVELSSGTAPAGGSVVVTAHGLAAGEAAEIWLDSDALRLSAATADASGVLTTRVTVPADTGSGQHTIDVRASQSGTASATLNVTVGASTGGNTDSGSAGPKPASSGLAYTGSEAGPTVLAGVVLLLLGAGLLLARRARKRA